jgi:hypothetical protein
LAGAAAFFAGAAAFTVFLSSDLLAGFLLAMSDLLVGVSNQQVA